MYFSCCVNFFLVVLDSLGSSTYARPLQSQLNLAITVKVLLNAGGVQLPLEDVSHVCFADLPELVPSEARHHKRCEPKSGLLNSISGLLVAHHSPFS